MSYNPATGFPRVVPSLSYHDVGAAIEWTRAAFGFEPVLVFEADGTVLHADMELEGGFVMFEAGGPAAPPAGPDRSMTLIYVTDAARHREQAAAAGAEIVAELRDTPWGLRQYCARDVEGHVWEFTQHLRDVEPAEWGAREIAGAGA